MSVEHGDGDDPSTMNDEGGESKTTANGHSNEKVTEQTTGGSMALRPLFFGNLTTNYSTDQITQVFENPLSFESLRNHADSATFRSIPVDRIDVKRGYCFVFLKDATSAEDKERIEAFATAIHGIAVPNVSRAIRAEFARGDGRVKRKEDERRKNIAPSDTLFVVNFHEETTKREDLEMLFEPFGKLLRIDLKRNYAFVQFQSIAEATAAKEATNGGKLDQSVLTVEYVARQRDRDDPGFRNRGGPDRRNDSGYDRGGGRSSSYDRGPMRYDDRGRGREDRPPQPRYPDDDRYRSYPPPPPMDDRRGMIDDRRGMVDDDRYARGRGGRDSPPPYSGRRRSRSRSPPGYRGRSPPPPPVRGGRYPDDPMDDYHRGGRGGDYPPPPRGRSPPPSRSDYVPDRFRASDRDHHRGYRG